VRAVPRPTPARLPPLVRQPCGTRWLLARCAAHALQESHPLAIVSFTANVAAGVTLHLAGSPAQLASARVTITLSRFLPPDHSLKQPLTPLAACAPRKLPAGSLGLGILDTPSSGKLVPELKLSEEVSSATHQLHHIPPTDVSIVRLVTKGRVVNICFVLLFRNAYNTSRLDESEYISSQRMNNAISPR
jgi:hypothetical protein